MKKGQQVKIPVICINDSHRPNEIPISKWVVRKNPYTIKEFVICNSQNRTVGVKLWEIDIDDCVPYTTFALSRFGIELKNHHEEANNAIKELLEESLKKEEVLV